MYMSSAMYNVCVLFILLFFNSSSIWLPVLVYTFPLLDKLEYFHFYQHPIEIKFEIMVKC